MDAASSPAQLSLGKENQSRNGDKQAGGLWVLAGKLVHPLAEVRVRALQNLDFKLKHGLIKQADLDVTLLRNVLGWFNLDNGQAQDVAMLDFLHKVAAYPSVAARLADMNARQLLRQLQHERSGDVATAAERVLAMLQAEGQHSPAAWPFPSSSQAPYSAGGSGITQTGSFTPGVQQTGNVFEPRSSPSGNTAGTFSRPATAPAAAGNRPGTAGSAANRPASQSGVRAATDALSTPAVPPDERAMRARARADWRQAIAAPASSAGEEAPLSPRWRLKRVPLGAADDQFIFDLNVRLQYSDDSRVLLQALEELHWTVCLDMPPEALLQRPAVLDNVLSLLHAADKDSPLPASALRVLHTLACRLKWAIGMAVDPAYCPPARPASGASGSSTPVRDPPEEAASRSYPAAPQDAPPFPPAALAVLLDEEREEVDVTAHAHLVAGHALGLLKDTRRHAQVLPLMEDLLPLLRPPPATDAANASKPASEPNADNAPQLRTYLAAVSDGAKATLAAWSAIREGGLMAELASCSAVPQEGGQPAPLAGDAATAALLMLSLKLLQAFPAVPPAEVMPNHLADLLEGCMCNEFVAACLPSMRGAVRPILQSVRPSAVALLDEADAAGQALTRLDRALEAVQEVCQGRMVPLQWLRTLSSASEAFPYMRPTHVRHAVASLVTGLLHVPASCNAAHDAALPLATDLLLQLLAHPLVAVRHASFDALTAAVAEEAGSKPAPAQQGAIQLLGDAAILRHLIVSGLPAPELRLQSSQLLQAVASHYINGGSVAGANSESSVQSAPETDQGGRQGSLHHHLHVLLPWRPWLACYQNHAHIGATISATLALMDQQHGREQQEPVGSSQPGSLSRRLRPDWITLSATLRQLFSRDVLLRQQAAVRLLRTFDEEEQEALGQCRAAKDPFAGQLDGTLNGSHAAVMNARMARTFSQQDVDNLASIVCSASLPPDLRRSAAEQLTGLAADARFHATLTAAPFLQTLLSAASPPSAAVAELDGMMLDMQLPLACLALLAELVWASPAARDCVLEDPARNVQPLLRLIYSPLAAVRRAEATLLAYVIFAPEGDKLAEGQAEPPAPANSQQPMKSTAALLLPKPFVDQYCFPIPVAVMEALPVPSATTHPPDHQHLSKVQALLAQRRLVQAAGGADGLLPLLNDNSGNVPLPAAVLRQSTALVQALHTPLVAAESLAAVMGAQTLEDCCAALTRLQQLCAVHAVAATVARSNWAAALQRLLTATPASPDDKALWLLLLPTLDTLVASHAVTGNGLQLLAMSLKSAALPLLATKEACAGQPNLPIALANHAGAFDGAGNALLTLRLVQVIMLLLARILKEGLRSGDPQLCRRLLEVLDVPPLLQLLLPGFIANAEAAYGSRVAAVQLLTQIVACAGDTWRLSRGQLGSPWDSCLVGCLGGLIRHVCMPRHDTRLGGFREKALLREALHCLHQVTAAVPASCWAPAWQSVGGTFWLTRLARDRETGVRAAAMTLLACLASPAAPVTRRMLLQGWPECGSTALKVALQTSECYAVRAAALRFVCAAMAASTAQAHSEVRAPPPAGAPPSSPAPTSNSPPADGTAATAANASPAGTSQQDGREAANTADVAADTEGSRSSPSPAAAAPPASTSGRAAAPASEPWPAVPVVGDLWDFGLETVLQRQTFWHRVPRLLQEPDAPPIFLRSLTAVLLQAATADPAALVACLDSAPACWGLLVTLLDVNTAAQRTAQHAALLDTLGHSAAHDAGHHDGSLLCRAQHLDSLQDASAPSAPALASADTCTDATAHPLAVASNVAQLLAALAQSMQSVPVSRGAVDDRAATPANLVALLQSYSRWSAFAAAPFAAPVTRAAVSASYQAGGLIEHVADAAACLMQHLPDAPAVPAVLVSMLSQLEGSMVTPAAALHAASSAAPLAAKLASCRLLATLLSSQQSADICLAEAPVQPEPNSPAGHSAALLCSGLTSFYSDVFGELSQGMAAETLLRWRATVAAALRALLAYSAAAKMRAVQTGLPEALLDCAADSHALMALAAGQAASAPPAPGSSARNPGKVAGAVVSTPAKQAATIRGAVSRTASPSGRAQSPASRIPRPGSADPAGSRQGPRSRLGPVPNAMPEAAGSAPAAAVADRGDDPAAVRPGAADASAQGGDPQLEATQQQLLLALSLLTHLVHGSPSETDARIALVKAGATESARRMWKMALSNDALLHELLGLLANMLPGCPSASTALCTQGNVPLLARLLKLLSKTQLELPSFHRVTVVLRNLAASADGAALLLKTGFLADCQRLIHHSLHAKDSARLAALLPVLVNVAAHAEGQKCILRSSAAPGLLDLILSCAEQRSGPASAAAFFLLRNLTFALENKAHFVTNHRALPLLLAAVERGAEQPEAAAYAASALWGLVYQGEKVKAALRGLPSLRTRLQSAHSACAAALRLAKPAGPSGQGSGVALLPQLVYSLEVLGQLLDPNSTK